MLSVKKVRKLRRQASKHLRTATDLTASARASQDMAFSAEETDGPLLALENIEKEDAETRELFGCSSDDYADTTLDSDISDNETASADADSVASE